MDWMEFYIKTPLKNLEPVSDVASLLADGGLYIEDYSNLEKEALEIARVDLIDEELLSKDRENAVVHLYLSPEKPRAEVIAFLSERLDAQKIAYEIGTERVKEEDWATAWKRYYHPISLSEKLAIRPSWEAYEPKEGQRVIVLDPGMAFGTGTHETTRLCLSLLEEHLQPGMSMLDIGCGSGILAISARLLGAGHVAGTDIDPVAVRVAGENAGRNGCDGIAFTCTDLSGGAGERFDVVCANIVADVIIRLAPSLEGLMHLGSTFVASGIIDERREEVESALAAYGIVVFERVHQGGWCALAARIGVE